MCFAERSTLSRWPSANLENWRNATNIFLLAQKFSAVSALRVTDNGLGLPWFGPEKSRQHYHLNISFFWISYPTHMDQSLDLHNGSHNHHRGAGEAVSLSFKLSFAQFDWRMYFSQISHVFLSNVTWSIRALLPNSFETVFLPGSPSYFWRIERNTARIERIGQSWSDPELKKRPPYVAPLWWFCDPLCKSRGWSICAG